MSKPRLGEAVTVLLNGQVLVAGGATFDKHLWLVNRARLRARLLRRGLYFRTARRSLMWTLFTGTAIPRFHRVFLIPIVLVCMVAPVRKIGQMLFEIFLVHDTSVTNRR